MMNPILRNICLNISMLVLMAYLFTRAPVIKDFIFDNSDRLYSKIILAVIFGGMGIVSTYTGISVQGAIANTRVIAIVTAGILGGPIAGVGAGIIAGAHRYLINIGGFTAIACALSTVLEGLIAGLFSNHIQKSKRRGMYIIGVTILAELVQMSAILLIARPFSQAIEVVKVIFVPMVFLNAIGVGIFINILDVIVMERDYESATRIKLSLKIVDRCLPYFKNEFYDEQNLQDMAKTILNMSEVSGVAMTNKQEILSCVGLLEKEQFSQCTYLKELIKRTCITNTIQVADKHELDEKLFKSFKMFTVVVAPIIKHNECLGCMMILINKSKKAIQAEIGFVDGLAKLFSTQLELVELDNQIKLRQRAEYQALQSQINPHFLFNALNTISALCREKPERARELLIVLSTYFRNTLEENSDSVSLVKEVEHVKAYLQLEKARFEERLQVEIDMPEGIRCTVPNFILQPIVENAVKHGAMSRTEGGKVIVAVKQRAQEVVITVYDNGKGIEKALLECLYKNRMDKGKVGLSNVHRRLKSVYGEQNGLQIDSTLGKGTTCTIHIPLIRKGEVT